MEDLARYGDSTPSLRCQLNSLCPDCIHKVYTHSFNLRSSLTSWSPDEDTYSAPSWAPNPYLSSLLLFHRNLSPLPSLLVLAFLVPGYLLTTHYMTSLLPFHFSPSCSHFSQNKMLILRATELLFPCYLLEKRGWNSMNSLLAYIRSWFFTYGLLCLLSPSLCFLAWLTHQP
jgi:hypothetical protein